MLPIIVTKTNFYQRLTRYVSPLVPLIADSPAELYHIRQLFNPLVGAFKQFGKIILSPVPDAMFITSLENSLNNNQNKKTISQDSIQAEANNWLDAWKKIYVWVS